MSSNTLSLNPIFIPTQISGCQLWLDAADSTTVTASGVNVNQWNDKSGNGRNAVYSLSNFATRTSSNSGLFLSNSYYTTTYTADPTNETFFVAFRSLGAQNTMMLSSPNPNGRFVGIAPTGVNPIYSVGFGKDAVTWGATTPITSNADVFTTVQFSSGAFSRISANGGTPETYTALTFTSGSNTNIGAALSGGNPIIPYIGRIYEILAYNSVLSTSNTQIVEGYIAWKWGMQANLPANHPYRNTPVVNINTIPRSLQASIPTSLGPSSSPLVFFRPTSIAGCSLWYDAADTTSMTFSGSLVSSWRSKGTNPIVVTSASSNPPYVSNVYNGQGVVRFTFGSNTPFLNNSVSSTVPQTTANHAIFLVHRPTTNTSSPFGYVTSTGSNRISAHTPQDANVAYDVGNNPGMRLTYNYGTIGAYLNGALRLETFYTTSPNFFYSRDGSQLATAATSLSTAFDATQLLYIGGIHPTFNTYYYGGDYCEIVWYNTALTTAQIQQVEGYLAWKWGTQGNLPANHPFKNIPPGLPSIPPTRQMANRFWQPTTIAGCSLWLDGADRTTLTLSGSNVTQWNDKSGLGNNASNVGTIEYSSVINGLSWNGTNVYLRGSLTNTTNVMSAYIVTNVTLAASRWLFSFTTNNSTSSWDNIGSFHVVANTSSNLYAFRNVVTLGTVANVTTTTPFIAGTVFNGASNTTFFNGAAGTTVASSGNFSIGVYNIGSGVNEQTVISFNGTVYEVLAFNAALSTSQRQQTEGYLAWKWGLQGNLPANHPFKRWPPPPA